MRTRTLILSGALLLVFGGVARAQQEQDFSSIGTQVSITAPVAETQTPAAAPAAVSTAPFAPKFGRIDFGFRGDSVSGDAARYQRFRDLRDGGYIDRLRLAKDTDTWVFRASAGNVGYRDQRYAASFESLGKLKVNFDWNQIPLFISDSTKSLYKDNGNGYLSIDDAVQLALQNATAAGNPARDAALASAFAGASRYDLRSRRDIGALNLTYTINRATDVKFDLKNASRSGYNLQAFGFGTSPGLLPAVELQVPLDDRTTDLKGGVEFANQRGLLFLGYTASWFQNNRPTLMFDNPLRATDISGGASKGLAPMWPTNHSFSYNVNGSYKLPGRSKASAAISVGQWNQNEALVDPTVNTALTLVAPPLERPTAEAKADIVSMVYNFNSRPNEYVWLNARYRYYDYANKTPLFETTALVGDWATSTTLEENEPLSIKRQGVELDASFTPHKYVGLNFGFGREDSDRTHRIFEKTAEDTFRVAFDTAGSQYVVFRTKFEHSNRTGSGFEAAILDEVGEQPDMRHFDVADRTRDRVTATLTVTPVNFLAVNGAVGTGKDKYGETGFGLRNNNNRTWSLGADLTPIETVSFGVNYGYEKYTALQYSRTANPLTATDLTFNDATRDWWLDQADTVKTFSATADFLKAIRKTDVRLSYDISDGKGTYVYGLKPEQKVFTTVPLTQLAPLKNRLTDARFDVQYYVRPNLALGAVYAFEEYKVDDFALGPQTLNSVIPNSAASGLFASTIYSGYLYRNYRANTGWLRLTFLW